MVACARRWRPCDVRSRADHHAPLAAAAALAVRRAVDDGDRVVGDRRVRLARAFADRGLEVLEAGDHGAAVAVVEARSIDRAVVDLRMPGPGGLAVVERLRALRPAMQIVVVTGYGSIATAVEAMRLGAHDYTSSACSRSGTATSRRRRARSACTAARCSTSWPSSP